MRGVRGANKQPGEIRRSQNWIGGTRPGNAVFVPAPFEQLPALLADLLGEVRRSGDWEAWMGFFLEGVETTADEAVHLLKDLGVLTEATGKQRDRTFAYTAYLEKLRVGTEVDVG
jgi:Fic family protein